MGKGWCRGAAEVEVEAVRQAGGEAVQPPLGYTSASSCVATRPSRIGACAPSSAPPPSRHSTGFPSSGSGFAPAWGERSPKELRERPDAVPASDGAGGHRRRRAEAHVSFRPRFIQALATNALHPGATFLHPRPPAGSRRGPRHLRHRAKALHPRASAWGLSVIPVLGCPPRRRCPPPPRRSPP